jgi:C4-type Zn-finger protein
MTDLCPICGCKMLVWELEIEVDQYGNTVVQVELFCGGCGYEDLYYED